MNENGRLAALLTFSDLRLFSKEKGRRLDARPGAGQCYGVGSAASCLCLVGNFGKFASTAV
jgi:hypothetical protein